MTLYSYERETWWQTVHPIDDTGEMFRKQHYDERLGWHESTVSRRAVREDLITRLTRSSSQATDRSHDVPVDNPDTFSVKPARKLQMDCPAWVNQQTPESGYAVG